jgi:hypothetical protein
MEGERQEWYLAEAASVKALNYATVRQGMNWSGHRIYLRRSSGREHPCGGAMLYSDRFLSDEDTCGMSIEGKQ